VPQRDVPALRLVFLVTGTIWLTTNPYMPVRIPSSIQLIIIVFIIFSCPYIYIVSKAFVLAVFSCHTYKIAAKTYIASLIL